MKKVVFKTRIVALALATLFTVSMTTVASATKNPNTLAELKYVGYINNNPAYQLALNNDAAGVYMISVKDSEGNVLYTERVTGSKIVRNYQLTDAPSENYSLVIVVDNLTTNHENVYQINKKNTVNEQVNISTIK
jgi:hypothetical protein